MELIGIREAARRLGVSDTAVHKAIKAGRVNLAAPTPTGRPRVAWPAVQDEWNQNTDVAKRSHAGPKRAPAPPPPPPVPPPIPAIVPVVPPKPAAEQPQRPAPAPEAQPVGGDSLPGRQPPMGPSYAQSRAIREAYQAKLAKLEFEERTGKLVDVDTLRIEAFKVHRRVRDSILNIPDRCAPQLATMEDASAIHAYLVEEISRALRQLAADIYAPN